MTDALIQTGFLPSPLSVDEQQRLIDYEAQVESGFTALLRIRDEGLWREYASFEAYFSARWNNGTRRRRNQILASLRVYLVLQEQLEGTGVPINATEFGLRSLVTLATENPPLAAQIYREAAALASGEAPSYSEVELAKRLNLTPDDIQRDEAVAQIAGMKRYTYLIQEIKGGGDATKLLGLAVALESCNPAVRRILAHADLRDLALIRQINEDYGRGSETAREILRTGYLQCEYFNVPLAQATARQYRQLKDIAYRENQQRARDLKRGAPESVVVFHDDPEGTLESLSRVLAYSELIQLGNLIGGM